ncbi:uncharacterized [Tachysurus ichikawai]
MLLITLITKCNSKRSDNCSKNCTRNCTNNCSKDYPRVRGLYLWVLRSAQMILHSIDCVVVPQASQQPLIFMKETINNEHIRPVHMGSDFWNNNIRIKGVVEHHDNDRLIL